MASGEQTCCTIGEQRRGEEPGLVNEATPLLCNTSPSRSHRHPQSIHQKQVQLKRRIVAFLFIVVSTIFALVILRSQHITGHHVLGDIHIPPSERQDVTDENVEIERVSITLPPAPPLHISNNQAQLLGRYRKVPRQVSTLRWGILGPGMSVIFCLFHMS